MKKVAENVCAVHGHNIALLVNNHTNLTLTLCTKCGMKLEEIRADVAKSTSA